MRQRGIQTSHKLGRRVVMLAAPKNLPIQRDDRFVHARLVGESLF